MNSCTRVELQRIALTAALLALGRVALVNSQHNCGSCREASILKTYCAVIQRDPDTGLFVGYVPGFRGAHTQASTLDELDANLREVISMILEDGEPELESEFVGVHTVAIS